MYPVLRRGGSGTARWCRGAQQCHTVSAHGTTPPTHTHTPQHTRGAAAAVSVTMTKSGPSERRGGRNCHTQHQGARLKMVGCRVLTRRHPARATHATPRRHTRPTPTPLTRRQCYARIVACDSVDGRVSGGTPPGALHTRKRCRRGTVMRAPPAHAVRGGVVRKMTTALIRHPSARRRTRAARKSRGDSTAAASGGACGRRAGRLPAQQLHSEPPPVNLRDLGTGRDRGALDRLFAAKTEVKPRVACHQ